MDNDITLWRKECFRQQRSDSLLPSRIQTLDCNQTVAILTPVTPYPIDALRTRRDKILLWTSHKAKYISSWAYRGHEVYSLFGQKRTGLEQKAWEARVLEVEVRWCCGALQVQTPDDHIQHSSHCSQLHSIKHGWELGGLQHGIHLDLGSRGIGLGLQAQWGQVMPTTLQMPGGLRDTVSDGVPQFRCFHRLLPGRHHQHLAATNQLAIIQITNSVSMDKRGTVFSFYNLTSISKMSKSKNWKMLRTVFFIRGVKIRSVKVVATGPGVELWFLLTGHPFVFFFLSVDFTWTLCPRCVLSVVFTALNRNPERTAGATRCGCTACWPHPFICRAGWDKATSVWLSHLLPRGSPVLESESDSAQVTAILAPKGFRCESLASCFFPPLWRLSDCSH